uniref:Uncharacterized protein n=1 Tax=Anguilla anguilla TaxID=7936 RepID=A0A0E9VD69_ANGAN
MPFRSDFFSGNFVAFPTLVILLKWRLFKFLFNRSIQLSMFCIYCGVNNYSIVNYFLFVI